MPLQAIGRLMAVLCLSLTFCSTTALAQSDAGAGRVKAASGSAVIVRAGSSIPARVGALVYQSDILRTGPDGQLAVMLRDETRLSLGYGSEVTLAAFAFTPADGRLSLVLRVARGALSCISGRIAKLMPDAVRLETPTSVIGVRGTHALIHVEAP